VLDVDRVFEELAAIGLDWHAPLETTVRERLADAAHGDLPRWRATLASLPAAGVHSATLDAPVVSVGPPAFDDSERDAIRAALLSLRPWRKGPFRIGDIHIDAEWRSDLKWARLAAAVAPLPGRRILDVGCGNGYYALRMRGAGAAAVVGIDPTLGHLAQFQAIRHWLPPEPVMILPLRLHELPRDSGLFDTVFSMGVLYHQRDPLDHLGTLYGALVPGGELVLETLVLPGDTAEVRAPDGRYARMRNVWHLPTVPQLLAWTGQAGFRSPRVVDVSETTPTEQRRTEWMPFESLADALDPADPARTVEGWPAPRRAVVLSTRP
jgi:tRNA (mo5U34)-methyltransferase